MATEDNGRIATLASDGNGDTVWRIPLATTINDLPLGMNNSVFSFKSLNLFTIKSELDMIELLSSLWICN